MAIATQIRDRKQADGHVIMTQRGYVAWLKQNKNTVVGVTGNPARMTPIMNYAKSLGLEFGHQQMPRWARNLNEAYQNYPMPSMMRGYQAIDRVLSLCGYEVAVAFYAEED